MTIATRYSKSWAIAGIDIKDPTLVLYLPLWYPYSDMTGSTIYSYNKNRLTGTVDGAVWGKDGRTFNGTGDNIDIGATTTLRFTSSFSLEAWAKHSVITGEQSFMSSQSGATSGYAFVKSSGHKPTFLPNCADSLGVSIVGNTSLLADIWYHVVGVYDASANLIYIYLNGVSDKTAVSVTGAPVEATVNLFIGRYGASSANLMNGVIGEGRIYSRALTAGEVRRNYQTTKWRF